MGTSIHTDICDNYLQLTSNIIDTGTKDYPFGKINYTSGEYFGDWICLSSSEECGREGKLYGHLFVKGCLQII